MVAFSSYESTPRPPESVRRRREGRHLWDAESLLSNTYKLTFLSKKHKRKQVDAETTEEVVVAKQKSVATVLGDVYRGVTEETPEDDEPEPLVVQEKEKDVDVDQEAIRIYGIRTGDDAVNFFSSRSHTQNAAVRFFHLVRAADVPEIFFDEMPTLEKRKKFRPYDLRVLPTSGATLARLGLEYFVMSAEGLVHVAPGEPSEFVALTTWIREAACFNMLTSIPFFRDYLRNKCFRAWRDNVRFLLFKRQRRKLMDTLFLGMPSFSGPLLALRSQLKELDECGKLVETGQKTFELQAFVDKQSSTRSDVGKKLDAVVEKAASRVHDVCKQVVERSKPVTPQVPRPPSEDEDPKNIDLDVVAKVIGLGGGGKSKKGPSSKKQDEPKSMAAAKDQEHKRRAALKRAFHEKAMLPDFVRLADYVAVEALVELAVASWASFAAELAKPRRQSGILETTVRFAEDGSSFAPTCERIQSVLAGAADDLIATLGGVLRILYVKPPKGTGLKLNAPPPTAELQEEDHRGPNVKEIIRTNPEWIETCEAIHVKIEADFKKAKEYVDVAFEKVWPIYEYSRKWDFEAYQREARTVNALKDELEKVATWEKELEKMRTRQTCGFLEVESRKLRQMLVPIMAEKMDALKRHTQNHARIKCKDQRQKYKAAIAKVTPRPTDLPGFSGLLDKLEEQKMQSRSLVKHTNVVEQMYQILAHHDVRVSEADAVQLDELRAVQVEYNDAIEQCAAYKDSKLPEMLQFLDSQLVNFQDTVTKLTDELNSPPYVDLECFAQPGVVLATLGKIGSRLESLTKVESQLKKQRKLFGLQTSDRKESTTGKRKDSTADSMAVKESPLFVVKQAAETFDFVRTLWTMVEHWDTDSETWLNDDFLSQNAKEIARHVTLYKRGAQNMYKKKDQNAVVKRLVELTSDLQDKVPLIRDLGSPFLEKRHWIQIFAKLGADECPSDLNFSLAQLFKMGLDDHKAYVSDLAQTAEMETIRSDVVATLNDIKEQIEAQNADADFSDDHSSDSDGD